MVAVNVLIFGATGMIGQGVLRECLLDPGIAQVKTIGRSATGQSHPKLREIVHKNLVDYTSIEGELAGIDACFFCLGITSAGMNEADYTSITYDIAIAAAQPLARLNPRMTFIYVSGQGTDSSEKGSLMWARVKGRAENALIRMPFQAYAFRPGVIQPMYGARSKTAWVRVLYVLFTPVLATLRRLFPNQVLTTERIGLAMLKVARHGSAKRILEARDINQVV